MEPASSSPDFDFSVVVAHHNDIIRRGLEEVLVDIPWVVRVQSCANWERALRVLATPGRYATEVLLVAGTLVGTGHEVLARRSTKVLLLQAQFDSRDLINARWADGFLLESTLSAQVLVDALSQVGSGQFPMPTGMARMLLTEVHRLHDTEPSRPHLLTLRELQALHFIAEGYSNKQIAVRMGIGLNGVKRHVSNLLAKMNCPNRTQAAAYAVQAGLIDIA